MIITYKFRIKDASAKKHLQRLATASNQVWNYCAATQLEAQRRWAGGVKSRWPTHFDLGKLTAGSAADLGIHSDTVNRICAQFAVSRDKARNAPRFRSSFGTKRALGWVPFVPRAIKIEGASITYKKRKYNFWKSRNIPDDVKCGAFVQDARGRWYVTFQCRVEDNLPAGNGKIGIDLGLKTLATCSDGSTVPALRHYRKYEVALAVAQRAGNKSRVKAIHAKIANCRRNQLHEASTKIARENCLIVVGNVNSAKLAKTRMAKSVLDAGWAMFRNMLRYKSARRQGAVLIDADERMTTQTCSDCGSIGGPKGIAGLGMRHWECSGCGALHDRDVNSAINILRVGQERLALVGEIPAL